MKVFISQTMRNKTKQEILNERNRIIAYAKEKYDDVHIIDSYFCDFEIAEHVNRPLFFLAKSLQLLAEADVAMFAPGWDKARGCKIEHEAAVSYGIAIEEVAL